MEPLQVICSQRMRILSWCGTGTVRRTDRGAVRRVLVGGEPAPSGTEEPGFITERRNGNSRIYRADKVALGSLRSVVEDQWRRGLGRVKELAEAEQRDKDRS